MKILSDRDRSTLWSAVGAPFRLQEDNVFSLSHESRVARSPHANGHAGSKEMVEFSQSAKNMRASEIRRLMKLAADPSIISFAGGMPNNSLFPCDIVENLYHKLSPEAKQAAFQYCPTSGYPPLLESLGQYLVDKGLPVKDNGLIITTGAQQAINLITSVLVDPGDTVLTEYPCFIGAVAAFKSYGAELIGTPMDDDGILIDRLREVLDGPGAHARFLYLSPCFHNPAGIIYSQDRKAQVPDLLRGRDMCLLEDDPYCELYFEQQDKALTTPMKANRDTDVPICYTGSFSKILGPGMRLGYLLGPKEVVEKCELAKQSMDACSATFTQVLAHVFLTSGELEPYLKSLRGIYKRRAGIMLNALSEFMPEWVRWTRPRGGFYIWVTLPENVDASDIFTKSIKLGAAFVIGNAFDPEAGRNNCFRLAFSHTPEEEIEHGVQIVAQALGKCYA